MAAPGKNQNAAKAKVQADRPHPGFSLCPVFAWFSQWLKAIGNQALVQNLTVNANALEKQLFVRRAEVRDQAFAMAGIKNADTTYDRQPVCLSKPAGRSLVHDHEIRVEPTREQYGC